MIKAIVTGAVVVSDIAKAAKWCQDTLGPKAKGDPREHRVTVGVKGAEQRLHLCEFTLEPGNNVKGLSIQRCFSSEQISCP